MSDGFGPTHDATAPRFAANRFHSLEKRLDTFPRDWVQREVDRTYIAPGPRQDDAGWSRIAIVPVTQSEFAEIAVQGIVALQKLRCYNWIMKNSIQSLTDEQLLFRLKSAASRERETTAHLIALLAEMDLRKLYLAEGYASLFVYCTRCLHLSEHAAYGRIEAARAARRFPTVLELLADGSITLTAVCLLATHLNEGNHRELLDAARHRGKREVEQQVAALAPQPDAPSAIRRLPPPKAPVVKTVAARGDLNLADSGHRKADSTPPPSLAHVRQSVTVVTPLAPERYKVQLTIGRDTHDKLRRVQDLLRHVVPNGDPAAIFDRALTLLLDDLERRRLSKVERPRPSQATSSRVRYVPATVKRQVWARDDGRCAFVGTDGRCAETGCLELHHAVPFADGGPTTVDNLQLRCRAHNAYEARERFGPMLIRERRLRYELGPDRAGRLAQHWCHFGETAGAARTECVLELRSSGRCESKTPLGRKFHPMARSKPESGSRSGSAPRIPHPDPALRTA